jgi:prepilin-type N-terminal cleavage/methylation domain-containing protein
MQEHGFTIIELIIAIFILSVAIIGVYSALSTMVVFSSNEASRLTAAYLAQEGMEVIRNIRDNNWISGSNNPELFLWDDGLYACEQPAGCEVDYKTTGHDPNSVRPWTNSHEDYLKTDENGFYNYRNGINSKFKRKITIETNSRALPDFVMKISVQVSWDEKPSLLSSGHRAGECYDSNCIKVEETLYNWY